MSDPRDYADKRAFDETPEPPPEVEGNVDPGRALPGKTFVIHQHHATRLHFDLRLEMLNGKTPVLVSWAVPKNLPYKPGEVHLAVHVEDHPFEYGSFSGSIPKGNYGAGEVRIFDAGNYEVLEQEPGKVTFRLQGRRMKGIWHLFRTRKGDGKDDWLVRIREDERGDPDPLPDLHPMLSTLARDPFDNDDWIFEPKWDGVRAIAVCDEQTMLMSRNLRDITATYPELKSLHDRAVAVDCVLDGEIVTISDGRPSFERLQSRMNLQNAREIERMSKQMPVLYVAFDLLYLDGHSLISEPLEKRKELLSELIVPNERVQVSSVVEGDGIALFEAASAQQLEGIVAKKRGCPYQPGRRAKHWIKIKTLHDADLVIGGWSRGEGSRGNTFGSLLVGAYEGDELRFVGSVGTGFTERKLDELMPQLKAIETDQKPFAGDVRDLTTGRFGKPIRDPHWVKPELVATVEFRELTSQGRLRAPSFKGMNKDVDAHECTYELLEEA
ncbi:MAG: non-homologous end-joining DNA ligase [Actinobacteria bacterium]|nr:non-homologous end-joining DNA ligase [Actinomycetota bacterium]